MNIIIYSSCRNILEEDMINEKKISKYYESVIISATVFNSIETILKCLIHKYAPSTNIFKKDINLYELCERAFRCAKDDAADIDFNFFLLDRKERNKLTHSGKVVKFLEAIRCMNNIRRIFMLIDSSIILPEFEYPKQLVDFQKLYDFVLEFNTNDAAYVLVTDSMHDLPNDQRKILANIQWDVVVDFDGTTKVGGFKSSVTHSKIKDVYGIINNLNQISLIKGLTTWITFGNYVCSNFGDNRKFQNKPTYRSLQGFFKVLARKLHKKVGWEILLW